MQIIVKITNADRAQIMNNINTIISMLEKMQSSDNWRPIVTERDADSLELFAGGFHDAAVKWVFCNPVRNTATGENIVLTIVIEVNHNESGLRNILMEFNGVQEFRWMPAELYEASPLLPGAGFTFENGMWTWKTSGAYTPDKWTEVRAAEIRWCVL